jgi:hypothetical protein
MGRDIYGVMMRLITAPCVGAVVGILTEGAIFAIVTVVSHEPGNWPYLSAEWVFFVATWGMALGGILGGIIGLVVALRDAQGREGLLLGSAFGFVVAVLILLRVGLSEVWAIILALSTIPAAASMGFLSAVSTVSNKAAQPAAEPRKSHRIFE